MVEEERHSVVLENDLNQSVNVVDGGRKTGEEKSEIGEKFEDNCRKNLFKNSRESVEDKREVGKNLELEDNAHQNLIGDGTESVREKSNFRRKLNAEDTQKSLSNKSRESVEERNEVRGTMEELDMQQNVADDGKESFETRRKLEDDLNQNLTDSGTESIKKKRRSKTKPEIVGVTYKKSAKDIFDSHGRKRGLLMLNSALSMDESTDYETQSVYSTDSESFFKKSWPDSFTDTNEEDDNITDFDANLFTGSLSRNSKASRTALQQLHGIHDFDEHASEESLRENQSLMSLRSVDSWPSFLGNGNMKKWNNQEDLNDVPLNSGGLGDKWLIGDTTDTGMSEHLLILLFCVLFVSS